MYGSSNLTRASLFINNMEAIKSQKKNKKVENSQQKNLGVKNVNGKARGDEVSGESLSKNVISDGREFD